MPSIDCETKIATVIDNTSKKLRSTAYHYGFFITAMSQRRVWPAVPRSLTQKQYLIETEEKIHALSNAKHGVAIGGGSACSIEMAAELKLVKPHVNVTLVHSRHKLLFFELLSDERKGKALEMAKEANVNVLMNQCLANTTRAELFDDAPKYEVEFTNGYKMVASQVITTLCKSVSTTTYLPSSTLDPKGYVEILAKLHLLQGFI